MYTIDFSSDRYVSGQIEFVEETELVSSLDEALCLAPSPDAIGLMNPARGYMPDVIKTAYLRWWAAYLPDQWAGARFEGLHV